MSTENTSNTAAADPAPVDAAQAKEAVVPSSTSASKTRAGRKGAAAAKQTKAKPQAKSKPVKESKEKKQNQPRHRIQSL